MRSRCGSSSTARRHFALPTLDALARAHQVVTVITQPDRPAGRGQRLTPSPVKRARSRRRGARHPAAAAARPEWPERLAALGADIAVVAAFGQILPTGGARRARARLDQRPRLAAAALSRRGADRLGHHPRRDGDRHHDVSDGRRAWTPAPCCCARGHPDRPRGDGRRAVRAAGAIGARVLCARSSPAGLADADAAGPRAAPRWRRGSRRRTAAVDWQRPARELVDRVRGCNPWPGAARSRRRRRAARCWRAARRAAAPAPPGTLGERSERSLAIVAGDGRGVLPLEVQPENRKAMRVGRLPARRALGRGCARRRARGREPDPRRPGRSRRRATRRSASWSASSRTARSPTSRSSPRSTRAPRRARRGSAPRSSTARCAGGGISTGASPRISTARSPSSIPGCARYCALTAYQLLFLDRVPRWAAVDEAVSIARLKSRKPGPRRVRQRRAARPHAGRAAPPAARRSASRRPAMRWSFPDWIAARWIARYGMARRGGAHGGAERAPAVTIRAKRSASPAKTSRRGSATRSWPIPAHRARARGPHRPSGGGVRALGRLRAGWCVIQDEASMLIARLLEPQPGELIADTCAAPGTKATHLAQLMGNRGSIIAMDPQAARLGLLTQGGRPARRLHRRGARGRRGLGVGPLEGPLRPGAGGRAVLEPRRAAPQSRREVAARGDGARPGRLRRSSGASSPRPPRWPSRAGASSTPPARSSRRRTRRWCRASSTSIPTGAWMRPADFPVAPDAGGFDPMPAPRARHRRLHRGAADPAAAALTCPLRPSALWSKVVAS